MTDDHAAVDCQEEEEREASERARSHAAIESAAPAWGPADSAELYNVEGWGAPYFHVSDRGLLAVRPHGEGASCSVGRSSTRPN